MSSLPFHARLIGLKLSNLKFIKDLNDSDGRFSNNSSKITKVMT